MPTRVSSVCAHLGRLGVSGVFFQGIGLRHIGVPSTMAWPPPGPKMITSYLSLRFVVFLTTSGPMYSNGTP